MGAKKPGASGRGAHYTGEADIARVVGPTVVAPWRRRIDDIRTPEDAERVVAQMKAFHVLDPASGCGNFLHAVHREMRRLEHALAETWTAVHPRARRPPPRPYFTLGQIHGIEIDPFAALLSRIVLWFGEHLAHRELGLDREPPAFEDMGADIRHADALLTEWPRPDGELAIVGNPPYLGVRNMRRDLGDAYVDDIFARFPENRAADYATYWFAKALDTLRPGERAGLVCTNSVAQNESREASLDRILARGGTITDAWRSYPWPGHAAVHVSIVNWVMGAHDGAKKLDGRETSTIYASLTGHVDVTTARRLAENEGLCFMGVTPGNHGFVLTDEQRDAILAADAKSAAVIRPFLVGRDVSRQIGQRPTRWIIDFEMMARDHAEEYVGAFRHVEQHVHPVRSRNPREKDLESWWRFWRAGQHMRHAIASSERVLVLPCVSPHVVVSRQPTSICFDHQLMVIALSSEYDFGVLQSRLHETWARATGSTLKGDLRYTNTTVFETFPFPLHEGGRYDPRRRPTGQRANRVAEAAEAFDETRTGTCKARGLGLTKVHKALKAGALVDLGRAYEALNDAVALAYGFPREVWRDDDETLRLLLQLNQRIAEPSAHRG